MQSGSEIGGGADVAGFEDVRGVSAAHER